MVTAIEFVSNKTSFNLLDGTKMQVDTAWMEISFTYKNGKNIFDTAYVYNFAMPYRLENRESFTFNFNLVDTTNMVFTNARENNECQLHPRYLSNEMEVILKQIDTATTIGWKHSIITDTITFTKVNKL